MQNIDYIINAHNFQKIQDCLSEASDMAMVTVDFQGTPVTRHSRCSEFCSLVRSIPELFDGCKKCDSRGGLEASRLGKPYIYRCHMGLVDLAIPIMLDGHYVGAALGGQILLKDEDETGKLERIAETPWEKGDVALAQELTGKKSLLPVMSRDRVQVIANMMFQITNYIIEEALVKITLSETLEPNSGENPKAAGSAFNSLILKPALEYIRTNYQRSISLDDMASLCNISSSYFSKLFNRITGYSFSNYINLVRVEKAQELLAHTDIPITMIAFDLGFEDNSYFDKVFKRIAGVTPSSYKAGLRNTQSATVLKNTTK